VIDRALGKTTAHGQPGMAGADDDGGDRANGTRSSERNGFK